MEDNRITFSVFACEDSIFDGRLQSPVMQIFDCKNDVVRMML